MSDASSLQHATRDRLATRLVLLVFASCFLTALAVSWVAIQSSRRALLGVLEAHLPPQLADLAHEQQKLFDRALRDAEALSEICAAAPRGERSARLSAALEETPLLRAATCLDAEARELASAGPAIGALTPLDTRGSAVVWLSRRERPQLVALVGAEDGSAQFAAELAASALVRAAAVPMLAPGAEVRIFDPEGRAAASEGGPPLRAGDPARGLREQRDAEGRRWIASGVPLPGPGGTLMLGLPFEAAFAPLVAVAERILTLNAAVVVVFSLLALRMTRLIVRPIEQLGLAVRRVADGELDVELPEPASGDEVATLTRSFNEMMRRLRRDQEQIQRSQDSLRASNRELQQANEILSQLSITDGLTRLHNHRFFQDHLTREIKRVSRSQEPLSMLLIDIDDFKALNDRLGHAAGDEVLVRISRILESRVRDCDLLARYGGEEFVVLCSGTDRVGAYHLAESIRTQVAESEVALDSALCGTRISVSIGVAQFDGDRKVFFGAADRALYSAKAQGKNCVVSDREL